MICVSIGRTRHKMMVAEYKALAERGARLVELRVDFLSRGADLSRLLAERYCPLVFTCRRPDEGGRFAAGEQSRLMLLRAAIADRVDYVDLELDTARKIPRFGPTKRIVSYHNFRETPHNLEALHRELADADADIVKLVTMANRPSDNVRMLQLVASANVPTIGFCMGDMGVPSRILCGKYGAPFTYATFHKERIMAPGQLSLEEMRDVYHFDAINRDTEVYALLGDPVGHSLSPLAHNTAFRELGLNKVYVAFRVPAEELETSLKAFEWLDVRGYSVTIPHKESVLRFAATKHDPVADIGAANTLVRCDGGWEAYNTDAEAALESLERVFAGDDGRSSQVEALHGKHALILGAGGAARAIAFALRSRGAAVAVCGRTPERAAALAADVGCRHVRWEHRLAQYADVLINCTPVGMHPNVNETPFEGRGLRPGEVVFDTVYNPERTLLLKEALERECRVITGVDMFVGQAARQFELFTGQPAPVGAMRAAVKRALSPVRVAEG